VQGLQLVQFVLLGYVLWGPRRVSCYNGGTWLCNNSLLTKFALEEKQLKAVQVGGRAWGWLDGRCYIGLLMRCWQSLR
jgi:hypothetical protein